VFRRGNSCTDFGGVSDQPYLEGTSARGQPRWRAVSFLFLLFALPFTLYALVNLAADIRLERDRDGWFAEQIRHAGGSFASRSLRDRDAPRAVRLSKLVIGLAQSSDAITRDRWVNTRRERERPQARRSLKRELLRHVLPRAWGLVNMMRRTLCRTRTEWLRSTECPEQALPRLPCIAILRPDGHPASRPHFPTVCPLGPATSPALRSPRPSPLSRCARPSP
jgi:hypothetical protein